MQIDIIAFNGVDELDVIGPLEVFRSAARIDRDLSVRLVTHQNEREIRGAFGLRFVPDGTWQPGEADVLVVPGGGWAARAETGAWAEYRRGTVLELLRRAATGTSIMAGVCTGTMLLAHAGIVGTRPATTHHAAWTDLAETGAQLVKRRVVDDGDLITSGGVTSGIDLALWLVARECAPGCADEIAERIEYAWQPPSAG